MTDKPVAFGVVGLGMGAARCRTIVKTPGARLAVVCDSNEERGRKAKEEHGCDWYPDYAKMLEREDIEVVVVMTPTGMHADMGIQAAAAGKHVVTTKPMDVTLEKADKLIAACRKAKVSLLVDFESRYLADNWKVKTALERGLFGKPILGEARMKWWRGKAYFGDGWHGTWRMDGGGSLMNQCVHYVDMLQWLMGPVDSVFGRFGIFSRTIETEDLTMSMLKFRSGAVGAILSTTTYPVDTQPRIEVHGDKGGAITVGNKIEFWMAKPEFNAKPGEQNAGEFAYQYAGPANVTEDMIGVLRQGKQPFVSGEEGRKSLEIILAVYESARRGKEVKLPLRKSRAKAD